MVLFSYQQDQNHVLKQEEILQLSVQLAIANPLPGSAIGSIATAQQGLFHKLFKL